MAVEASMESPLVDPLTGEDFGIPLLGIVDLVLDEPQGPVIADFLCDAPHKKSSVAQPVMWRQLMFVATRHAN